MSILKNVSLIILLEPNIETALEFYMKLGLSKIFHIPGRWAELRLGDIKIGLCPTSQASADVLRNTGLVFEVEDVKAFYADHKDSIVFLAEPKEALHGIMISMKDPGGNIIDLYQPTPEKLHDALQAAGQNPDDCCKQQESCCKEENETAAQKCC